MKGIIITSKYLVWPSAVAWAFFPFILVKDEKYRTDKILNHERIHLAQQLELLVVPFYLLYVINFLINLLLMRPRPYRMISFEREAFGNEDNFKYLDTRKFWAWTKYIA